MEKLKNACEKLLKLKGISGKNGKVAYLNENKDDEDFKTLLRYRYDIFKTYKIKKLDVQYCLQDNISLTLEAYLALLDELNKSNINATLRKKVSDTIATGYYLHKEILEGIITKKLSLGVDTTVKAFLNLPSLDCSLASPIKENTKIPISAIVELKYDGVRCIGMVEDGKCTLFTRQGRQLNFPQIEEELVKLAGPEDLTFDGELETQARTDISGICNKNLKSGYSDGADDIIIMHLFDELPTKVFTQKLKSLPQKERTSNLQRRMANFKSKRVVLGESMTVQSLAKIQELNNTYIKDGKEGIIIKDPNATYAYKRSTNWLKMKVVQSTTLKILGVTDGTGKRKGKIGALMCESEDGLLKVNVGSGLSDEDIKLFTETSPKGKYVEVIFNVLIKGRSGVYSLFLPRYKELRVDRDEADTLQKIKDEHIGKIEEAL